MGKFDGCWGYHQGQAKVELTPATTRAAWSYGRLGKGHVYWASPPARNVWNRMGFAAWHDGWMSSFADSSRRVWAMPAWATTVVFALLPALWVMNRVRRPHPKGRCAKCGYDLRATPARCSECGAVATA
jgi:hypothetical protein